MIDFELWQPYCNHEDKHSQHWGCWSRTEEKSLALCWHYWSAESCNPVTTYLQAFCQVTKETSLGLETLVVINNISCIFSSVQSLSRVWLFATPWTTARQASLSITNSWNLPKLCLLSWWCHPTISSSVVPFSSCPQSFPASGSSQMSQLFASSGQSIGVSASTAVLPMNTQDWSPLGWTSCISLQSKGLSRVLSNTTVQKHQFF